MLPFHHRLYALERLCAILSSFRGSRDVCGDYQRRGIYPDGITAEIRTNRGLKVLAQPCIQLHYISLCLQSRGSLCLSLASGYLVDMSVERARELDKAAEDIFQRMLADHMLTTTIRAHRQAKRSIVPCAACGTKCRSHSTILPSLAATSSASRASTPSSTTTSSHTLQANGGSSSSLAALNGTSGTRTPSSGVGGSTGIGSGSGKPDGNGNVFFECLNCGRPTASTRYATHLSGCLGIGGSRRAASRVAAAKVKMGANDRSSPSPYVHSEVGLDSDNESMNGGTGRKKKGRAPVVNGVKRAASPAKATLSKKAKSGSLAPSSRSNMPYAPSRLRASPANASSPTSTPSPTRSTQSLPSGFGSGSASKTLPGSGLAMGGWGMGMGGDLAGTVETESADAAAALGSDSSDGGADDDY